MTKQADAPPRADLAERPTAQARLRQHATEIVIALVTLALFAAYLFSMLRHTGGRISAPIDDVYIHFNYARHLAAGHLFEYNPGDGLSTGATSLLWTPIVAVGLLLGLRDTAIIYWTLGLNVCCLFAYGLLLYRLALLFFDSRVLATLLATLIIMEGRVLWGFFAGMEIGLYHVLLVGALYSFALYQRDGLPRQRRWFVTALSLLVFVRPEGSFLAGFALLAFAGWRFAQSRKDRSDFSFKQFVWRKEWLVVSLPIALVLLQWLVFYLTTGEVTQNGMRTKSHLYQPDQTAWGVLIPSFKFYRDMIFRHFPWLFAPSLRHLMDIFLYAGFLVWSVHEIRQRRPGMFCIMALWFFGGLGIQSLMLNAAYHHGRYQMNYTFIFWFVFIAGVHLVITRLRIKPNLGRIITGSVMGFFMVMMINTVVIFTEIYGKDCRAINDQHVAMARYVAANVPEGAAVGINDAGAIAYLGGHYVYDVFGLTTNVAAQWRRDGQACIWEQITYLDPDRPPRRPDYFAIYPKWYPAIVHAGFLQEHKRFHVPEPNICGADTKAFYSIDWSALGDKSLPWGYQRQESSPQRWIDHVDIAYRPDEMAHGYRMWRNGRPSEWGSDLVRYAPYDDTDDSPRIADGGRDIAEKEEIVVHNATPHAPLVVVRRTEGASAAAHVLVDGRSAGGWAKSHGSSAFFRDESFEIPASLVTSPQLTVRFEVASAESTEETPQDESAAHSPTRSTRRRTKAAADKGKRKPAPPRYRAYYYWFGQP